MALNSFGGNLNSFNSKTFVLDWINDHVDISEIKEPIGALDYDQLLSSEAFGHMSNMNQSIDETLRELSELISLDKPSRAQRDKINRAKRLLTNIMFPRGTTLIEREVERDYRNKLIKMNQKLRTIILHQGENNKS